MLNADKVTEWQDDIVKSVALYNTWFLKAAPKAYSDTRQSAIDQVRHALTITDSMRSLTPTVLASDPAIISPLRMMTGPPLARDRLIGLGGIKSGSLIRRMENGSLPTRIGQGELEIELEKICLIINRLLDKDVLGWLDGSLDPEPEEVFTAAMVVADRLCGSVADPIIRNAQEQRQLALIGEYLEKRGYERKTHSDPEALSKMSSGTYSFRQAVSVGPDNNVNMPIDVVIQPISRRGGELPILLECKSAGDFTNTNKRRKEEAQKFNQLKAKFGEDVPFYLFLCGYFDAGYLGYEAAEGIDWIWEHRIDDMDKLGL